MVHLWGLKRRDEPRWCTTGFLRPLVGNLPTPLTTDGRRILIQDGAFVAYQPFAASVPHETWIVPRTAQASFAELRGEAVPALAKVLRRLLGALRVALDNPAYNLLISSIPPAAEGTGYFVWHLRVLPRISIPAGLELETRIAVNPSLPEATAEELRKALQPPDGAPPGAIPRV